MAETKYAAFISYSHKDEVVARWLHRRLESYAIPRGAAPGYGRKSLFGRRVGRVFRDREELPAGYPLSDKINEALAQSDALIVLCSPNAAKSEFVNKEILEFQRLGKGDRIFPVIVAGEDHEIFPPALSDKREILEADMRVGKDGRVQAALKVLAGILGLEPNDLTQREARARRLRLGLAGVGVATFAILAIIAQQRSVEAVDSQRKADSYLGLVFNNYTRQANQFLLSEALNEVEFHRSVSISYVDVAKEYGSNEARNDLDQLSVSCPVRTSACFPEIPGDFLPLSQTRAIYHEDENNISSFSSSFGPLDRSRLAQLFNQCSSIDQAIGDPLNQLCNYGKIDREFGDIVKDGSPLSAYLVDLSDNEFVIILTGWTVGSSGASSAAFSYYYRPLGSSRFLVLVNSKSADSFGVLYDFQRNVIGLTISRFGYSGRSQTFYSTDAKLLSKDYMPYRRAGLNAYIKRSVPGQDVSPELSYGFVYLNDEIIDRESYSPGSADW